MKNPARIIRSKKKALKAHPIILALKIPMLRKATAKAGKGLARIVIHHPGWTGVIAVSSITSWVMVHRLYRRRSA